MSSESPAARCAMCTDEVGPAAVDCHECQDPSCAGSGCGFWCGDCGDWTCHDCGGSEFDTDSQPLCDCCVEAED